MSFGADCLINKLNGCITGLGADLATACDFAQVSGSLNSLENATLSVPNVNSLPAAADNEGRFIYVEDIKSFRYSDGYYWTKDACSVLGNVNTYSSLWTWGYNNNGGLGDGTTTSRCSPGTVAGGGATWCNISGSHVNLSAAIKTDGTIWTWGSANASGGLGTGVAGSGRSSPGTVAGGGTTWCQISVGGFSFMSAIKTDGTLWTWGANSCGELGNGTTTSRCSPGTVAGGGANWCQTASNINNINAAIKTDGTLWTWGSNTNGLLGDGTTVSRSSPGTVAGGGTNWCQISGGFCHMGAIKCDGTLWTWGCNANGQLGDGTTVSRSSPGTVAGGGTTWRQVSSGCVHAAAIKTDGTLWTWGQNNQGRLGDGTANTTSRCSPGTVAGGGTNWCQVSSADAHTSALKTDGTLWTWGDSACGALGTGTTVDRCSPGTVAGGSNSWFKVKSSDCSTFAIRTRGF